MVCAMSSRWHEQRLGANDMNGYLDWWNFVDWVWDSGTPVGRDGSSAILTLQYVYTLQQAEKYSDTMAALTMRIIIRS